MIVFVDTSHINHHMINFWLGDVIQLVNILGPVSGGIASVVNIYIYNYIYNYI